MVRCAFPRILLFLHIKRCALADLTAGRLLEDRIEVTAIGLYPLDPDSLKPPPHPLGLPILNPMENTAYHEELVEYVFREHLMLPIGLGVRNLSGTAATNVQLRAEIPKGEGIEIWDVAQMPDPPSKYITTPRGVLGSILNRQRPMIEVEDFADRWTITVSWPLILPRATVSVSLPSSSAEEDPSTWNSRCTHTERIYPIQLRIS